MNFVYKRNETSAGNVEVRELLDGDEEKVFEVAFGDFARAISNLGMRKTDLDILFPSIHFVIAGNNIGISMETLEAVRKVIVEIPVKEGGIHRIEYKEYTVPMPSLEWSFILLDGTFADSFVVAFKRIYEQKRISKRYFRAPILNVFDDHRICWGRFPIKKFIENDKMDFSRLGILIEEFWKLHFNLDLQMKVLITGAETMDYSIKYNKKSIKEIPYELFIPIDWDETTLGKLIKK